jgi:thiol-disulfide isomerase/thioredoxin
MVMKKLILVVLLLILSGCIPDGVDVITPVIVSDGDVLSEELCKNLDAVVVIEKTGCPACAMAIPRLEALEEELGLEFDYYNTAIDKERTALLALGFVPTHVPTIIVDCNVYAGALSKEKYEELISEWLVA